MSAVPDDQEPTVLVTTSDGVATVTLSRPDALNALTPAMGIELVTSLRRLEEDPAVRAIVLTGAGRGFCSGADLRVLSQGADALDAFATDPVGGTLPTTMMGMRTPVVAAVNGPSAGVGFVLTLLADVRFASPTATFNSAFARLGLTAEYGSAWLLPRLIGHARATEILLSGRSVAAAEALDIGLVTAVADDVLAAAQEWARQVAESCSPRAVATIKDQLNDSSASDFAESARDSLDLMVRSFRWPDLAEALNARMEKRPPQFPAL
jgi:enoyl-CoA hydratase/carnithine racemase